MTITNENTKTNDNNNTSVSAKKASPLKDHSLVVDISDALSERDRVKFTVQTRTNLPHFAKHLASVVRQHKDFIWLHDCLEDNNEYIGYIIPPSPPTPDFDASREKLQRLGDNEPSMSKEEFAKMKLELEAEYLAIFKKTVAMHEIFLQRLAAHEKFKYDYNLKIFLEYENELSVRPKSAKEKFSGFLQNIGRSAHDLVITTSQVAASTATSSLFVGHQSLKTRSSTQPNLRDIPNIKAPSPTLESISEIVKPGTVAPKIKHTEGDINDEDDDNRKNKVNFKFEDLPSTPTKQQQNTSGSRMSQLASSPTICTSQPDYQQNSGQDEYGDLMQEQDEQHFQKERLLLAIYYKSIREAASNSERVTLAQKAIAESYLQISRIVTKLAAIEILPIIQETKDSSSFLSCPLPSLTLPLSLAHRTPSSSSSAPNTGKPSTSNIKVVVEAQPSSLENSKVPGAIKPEPNLDTKSIDILVSSRTSEGLKRCLVCFADYLDQARKIESRIAADEDLKLTDTFLYYKRDTDAASDLINRRQRFMAEYETATKNLEKSRYKNRASAGGNMQYADVIQKQAKDNFLIISKLAKQELVDYKERRVAAMKKAFSELVELEIKHLKNQAALINHTIKACHNIGLQAQMPSTSLSNSINNSSANQPSLLSSTTITNTITNNVPTTTFPAPSTSTVT